MNNRKKVIIVLSAMALLASSAYGVSKALELRESCSAKIKEGQTCESCIKVQDLIERLGLEVK